jgi:ribonuclease HII
VKTITHIIGIDEAGRGPLAGPVAIGVVKFPSKIHKEILRDLKKIKGKDSKKLSHTQRRTWFEKIKIWKVQGKLDFHVALVSEKVIDTKGISFAIKKGMKACLRKVQAECMTCLIKLDGSLKAPQEFMFQQTIIKGDEKEPVISLASIAAKMTRDSYVVKQAGKYPEYKLEVHKGYGTALHRALIKKHGPSSFHRITYLSNLT